MFRRIRLSRRRFSAIFSNRRCISHCEAVCNQFVTSDAASPHDTARKRQRDSGAKGDTRDEIRLVHPTGFEPVTSAFGGQSLIPKMPENCGFCNSNMRNNTRIQREYRLTSPEFHRRTGASNSSGESLSKALFRFCQSGIFSLR